MPPTSHALHTTPPHPSHTSPHQVYTTSDLPFSHHAIPTSHTKSLSLPFLTPVQCTTPKPLSPLFTPRHLGWSNIWILSSVLPSLNQQTTPRPGPPSPRHVITLRGRGGLSSLCLISCRLLSAREVGEGDRGVERSDRWKCWWRGIVQVRARGRKREWDRTCQRKDNWITG